MYRGTSQIARKALFTGVVYTNKWYTLFSQMYIIKKLIINFNEDNLLFSFTIINNNMILIIFLFIDIIVIVIGFGPVIPIGIHCSYSFFCVLTVINMLVDIVCLLLLWNELMDIRVLCCTVIFCSRLWQTSFLSQGFTTKVCDELTKVFYAISLLKTKHFMAQTWKWTKIDEDCQLSTNEQP